MTIQNTPVWSSRTFDTLDQCLTFVQQKYQQTPIQCLVKDMDTGEEFEGTMPSYLFRGEVGWFSECLSRMERIRRGCFPGVTEVELKPIEKDTDNYFKVQLAKFKINPMLSKGLMQHYGFPTDLIDASDSIHTAAFFARLEAGDIAEGAFAVFDMKKLVQSSPVFDLSDHPMAVRPRRQKAYAIPHYQHLDLKDKKAMSDMGITWYTFRTDPCENSRVKNGESLLSVPDDKTAGLLRLSLDDSIKKQKKVTHPVAVYLANRIAHCPLVARVKTWWQPDQPNEIELITPKEAGISINNQSEINKSVKLWSRKYPNRLSR